MGVGVGLHACVLYGCDWGEGVYQRGMAVGFRLFFLVDFLETGELKGPCCVTIMAIHQQDGETLRMEDLKESLAKYGIRKEKVIDENQDEEEEGSDDGGGAGEDEEAEVEAEADKGSGPGRGRGGKRGRGRGRGDGGGKRKRG